MVEDFKGKMGEFRSKKTSPTGVPSRRIKNLTSLNPLIYCLAYCPYYPKTQLSFKYCTLNVHYSTDRGNLLSWVPA